MSTLHNSEGTEKQKGEGGREPKGPKVGVGVQRAKWGPVGVREQESKMGARAGVKGIGRRKRGQQG